MPRDSSAVKRSSSQTDDVQGIAREHSRESRRRLCPADDDGMNTLGHGEQTCPKDFMERGLGRATRVVLPAPGGPDIHVTRLCGFSSRSLKSRSRGRTAGSVGRVILAIEGCFLPIRNLSIQVVTYDEGRSGCNLLYFKIGRIVKSIFVPLTLAPRVTLAFAGKSCMIDVHTISGARSSRLGTGCGPRLIIGHRLFLLSPFPP